MKALLEKLINDEITIEEFKAIILKNLKEKEKININTNPDGKTSVIFDVRL